MSLAHRASQLLASGASVIAGLSICSLSDTAEAQSAVFDVCGLELTDERPDGSGGSGGSGGSLILINTCPESAVSGGIAGASGSSGGGGWSIFARPMADAVSVWGDIPEKSGGSARTYRFTTRGFGDFTLVAADRIRFDHAVSLNIQAGSARLEEVHLTIGGTTISLPAAVLADGSNSGSVTSPPLGLDITQSDAAWEFSFAVAMYDLSFAQSQSGSIPEDGIVISVASGCGLADFAEPFGVLDLADITAFVSAFVSGEPAADVADPIGIFDLADLTGFVGSFLDGCE